MVKLTVNGRQFSFETEPSGVQLLEQLKLTPATVVAELNGEVVKREQFLELTLGDGDVIELVTVVGGG